MATTTLNQLYSSIATDPLRSFRFRASFVKTGDAAPFDSRIVDTSDSTVGNPNGTSNGWQGGFTTISGLSINTQNITYREGGFNTTVHQMPGMTTFQPIQFSRGVVYGNDQAMVWMRVLFAAAQGSGLNSGGPFGTGANNFRVDVYITVNDHPNTNMNSDFPLMAFKIHNAFITGLNYTDLDATNGSILFESMTLTHEGLSVYYLNPANAVTGSGQTADGFNAASQY